MKACAEYQEIIWMDLYDELKPNLRSRFQRHLETCPACHRERNRMGRLMDAAREAAPAGELSPAAAETMTRSITKTLRRDRERPSLLSWLAIGRGNPFLGPAAAGLALLLLVWFGVQAEFGGPPDSSTARLSPVEQTLLQEDYEVIRNLDLLEEMDTVEKLVQVVDKREYGRSEFPKNSKRSGITRNHGIKGIEV